MAANDEAQFDPNPVAGELSPTTLVLKYLREKGIKPTNANVSAAVREALAGNITGLRSDTAATEAEDQAAMRGRGGPSVGQSGSAAGKVEAPSNPTQRGNPPNADLTRGPTNEADWQPNTAKTTSASPDDPTQRTGPQDASDFLTPAIIASLVAGASAIPGMMNRRAEFVGNAQPASGRVTDVDPTAIAAPETKLLPQQDVQLPPPTSMEQAMQQATAPARGIAAAQPGTAMPPADFNPVSGVNPYVGNPMAMTSQPLPAGINPYEAGGSASPAPTTTVLPENTRGAPVVPLGSAVPRDVPMRQMTTPSFYRNLPAQARDLFNLGRHIP